jgi:DNA-binding MarR family transcriptional regulator
MRDGAFEVTGEQPEASHDADAVAIARALDLWLSGLGRQFGPLSRRQRHTLRALTELGRETGAVRAGDLAEFLGITSAGATRMLNRLEDDGYVSRFRDPEADQREVYIAPTAAGIDALRAANEVYFERVAGRLDRLNSEEREALARLLEKLTEAG